MTVEVLQLAPSNTLETDKYVSSLISIYLLKSCRGGAGVDSGGSGPRPTCARSCESVVSDQWKRAWYSMTPNI